MLSTVIGTLRPGLVLHDTCWKMAVCGYSTGDKALISYAEALGPNLNHVKPQIKGGEAKGMERTVAHWALLP